MTRNRLDLEMLGFQAILPKTLYSWTLGHGRPVSWLLMSRFDMISDRLNVVEGTYLEPSPCISILMNAVILNPPDAPGSTFWATYLISIVASPWHHSAFAPDFFHILSLPTSFLSLSSCGAMAAPDPFHILFLPAPLSLSPLVVQWQELRSFYFLQLLVNLLTS